MMPADEATCWRLPFPFRLRVVPRTLRFKRPAGTSRGVYHERAVWYIVLTSATPAVRFTGLGECAPLYDLSCDFTPDYAERLHTVCHEVEAAQCLDTERLRPLPSMLFGLETAFRSALGSLERGDYRQLFTSDFALSRRGTRINGLIWMGTYEEMRGRLEEKLAAGYRCIKIKIGEIDFERELDLIRRLRADYDASQVELRLDANGAFAPDEALRKLERLAAYDIQSIEQPIRQGQWEAMQEVCRLSPIPIALDEELIGIHTRESKVAMIEACRPAYLILKPSLHGGLTGAAEWMELARAHGVGYWTTSALESNVGLNAIAQWQSEVDGQSQLAQGLGTGQLFVSNADAFPLEIRNNRLWYGDEGRADFRTAIDAFTTRWADNKVATMPVHTSGSTGTPKAMEVEKRRMTANAEATIEALGLHEGDRALLCLPMQYIAGQMVVVRALTGRLNLVVQTPASRPLRTLHEAPDFAAMTPMQVYESLRHPHDRRLLRRIRSLIIGGGAISAAMAETLTTMPGEVWSTYGMTETLSHIALRRLSGPKRSDRYRPMPGATVSSSPEGTLVIHAPRICAEALVTNDLTEIFPDGSFRILGRRDNVICSGGLKLSAEDIERRLEPLGLPLLITHVSDPRLGQAVTLLYVSGQDETARITDACARLLDRHERPRHILRLEALPLTPNGKPARAEAARLAQQMVEENLRS